MAGKDATEDFDEIGHSKAANEMLKKFEIGDFQVGHNIMLLCHLWHNLGSADFGGIVLHCLAESTA